MLLCVCDDACIRDKLMCTIFPSVSAAGLEVIVSGNPTAMCEGISSSPHSSPLDLPLSLSGEMESTAY